MKFLWIYPPKSCSNGADNWIFYGTEKQYMKWLLKWEVPNPKRTLKASAKFKKVTK